MLIKPTSKNQSCRNLPSEKQAIRESLAPFAPFPGALEQPMQSEIRQKISKAAKKRSH